MKPEKFPPTLPPLDWPPCAQDGTAMDLHDVQAEIRRADALHGRFPTIQHAAAVLRRECEEAWAEVWLKPVNRAALRMELLHVAATAARFVRLLDQDKTIPKPGPFAVGKAGKE